MPEANALLIFGATRGVGLELARHAAAQGRRVAAMVRPGADTAALAATGALLVQGDALSPEDVARAFAALPGPLDVVSTMGGRAEDGRRADEHGHIAITTAALESRRAARVLFVTSIGCGEMAPYRSERAIAAFGPAVDAKTRGEDHLRASGLPWTILRPGGLLSEPATGRGILSGDPELHGMIHREDVALLVLRALRDPATVGRALAAVDADRATCANPVEPFPLAA